MDQDQLRALLLDHVAAVAGMRRGEIDTAEPLSSYGLESVQAAELSGALEGWLGRPVSVDAVFRFPTIDALADGLTRATDDTLAAPEAAPVNGPVAIVGIGCRFPGATGPEEYWRLLTDGRSAVSSAPAGRWAERGVIDDAWLRLVGARSFTGGFLDDIASFDASFFGISAREAERTDPQQRLFLEVAWEALEDAGIGPSTLRGGDTAVYVGASVNEYSRLQGTHPDDIDAYLGTGNALSVIANRVSYALDLHGPSVAVDTACSSSLVAVHLACQTLRLEESAVALAGGVNLLLSPALHLAFESANVLSSSGRCRPFDTSADGYVRGEGVGVVVLQPLEAALAAGRHVYAVIRGSAVNQDGQSNGLLAPNPAAQVGVVRQALRRAGAEPADVAYVEAHGTGTRVGDEIELGALRDVFAGPRAAPVVIGSTKAIIGHLEAAAGVAGLIKAALAIDHGVVPPASHVEDPNPVLRTAPDILDAPPVAVELVNHATAVVGVSSFGFGGTNAHAILAAPELLEAAVDGPATDGACPGDRLLVTMSVRNRGALPGLAARYADALEPLDSAAAAHLAAAAALRRDHLPIRLSVEGSTPAELAARLRAYAAGRVAEGVVHGTAPRRCEGQLAMVFPGHGASWWPLPAEVLAVPAVATVVSASDRYLGEWFGFTVGDRLATGVGLRDRRLSQPALVVAQLALAAWWSAVGVRPDVVLGHSVGEVAAARVAGALSLEDALEIAVARGSAIQAHGGDGALAIVSLDAADMTGWLAHTDAPVWLAAVNGPGQCVVSGPTDAVDDLVAALTADGTHATRLDVVDYPAHSPLMAAAADDLADALVALAPRDGKAQFVSSVSASPVVGADLDAEYWGENLRRPVAFREAVDAALDYGATSFLECHPRPALGAAMAQTAGPDAVVTTADRTAPLGASMLRAVGRLHGSGRQVSWPALVGTPTGPARLPTMPWIRQRYWYECARRPAPAAATGSDGPGRSRVAWPAALWRLFADHEVAGVAVVPAAAFLAAAHVALRNAHLARTHELRHVTLDSLLPAGEPTDLAVIIGPDEVGRRAVSITAGDGTVHLSAVAVAAGGSSSGEDMPAALSRCPVSLPVAALYDRLASAGLRYGPAFAGLAELRVGNGEAVGVVTLPPAAALDTPLDVHPALFDACFHVVAGLVAGGGGGDDLLVPVGFDRVRIEGPLPDNVVVHAVDDGGEYRVRIVSDGGSVVAAVDGIRLAPLRGRGRAVTSYPTYRVEHVPLPATAPDAACAVAAARGGAWLVLADESGVGAALADRLLDRGVACTTVSVGDCAGTDGVPDEDRLADRLREAFADGGRCGRIVHLWSLDSGVDDITRGIAVAAASVPAVLRALTAARVAGAPTLAVVTRGATPPNAANANGIVQAAAWGLGQCLAIEAPALDCLRIDLADPDPGTSADQALAALLTADDENQVVVDADGNRLVPRLLRHDAGAVPDGRRPEVRGTWILSGGFGALGMLVAEHLASLGAEGLVLLGRRGPVASDIARIAAIESSGAQVLAVAADVTDRGGLAAVLDGARRSLPPVRGVVHAAGILDDAPLAAVSRELIDRVAAPKIAGAWYLHELTSGDDLDAFVLFSSAVSVLGSPGQSAYGAANAGLDALAAHRRTRGLPATSVNWGPWADIGLAAERVAAGQSTAQLSYLLDPSGSLAILDRVLVDGPTQLAVLPVDVSTLVQYYPVSRGIRFFERCIDEADMALRGRGGSARVYERPDLAQDYVEPEGELEQAIADLWRVALSIDRVGLHDSLFELGGDSVLAGQVLARIAQQYDVRVEAEDLYEDFTVARLAVLVEESLIVRVKELSEEEIARLLGADA